MIVFYLALFVLLLTSLRHADEKYNRDYISKEQSNIVKGLFIWIVFMRHIMPYIFKTITPNIGDALACYIDAHIKQLLVAPFLFYSGYGVFYNIKNRGGTRVTY